MAVNECHCEHERHDRDPGAHAMMAQVEGAAPANAVFQYGDNLCPACLTHCHPTARLLDDKEIRDAWWASQ